MNKATRDIAALLGIDPQAALAVQRQMEINGLDFSECTQEEFNTAAHEAYKEAQVQTLYSITDAYTGDVVARITACSAYQAEYRYRRNGGQAKHPIANKIATLNPAGICEIFA